MDIQINKPKNQTVPESQESVPTPTISRKHLSKQRFLNRVMLFILIITISFGGYFYYKLHKLQTSSNSKKEAQDLLGKVAKLYLIPTGEEPTVATVSDPQKLKDQAFFQAAQKDDKVLIFTQAGKAVLYRPSIDKIIEIAPINNKKNETPQPAPEKSTAPLKDKTF